MKKKITVAVLSGGESAEREISLESGRAVAAALRKKGFQVLRFDPKKDLPKLIQQKQKIDVVFPALHGRGGEDGTLQGLLELLQIPYVGSTMSGMIVSFDKVAAKRIYYEARLPIAKDFIANKSDSQAAEQAWKKIGQPAFVKPAAEGSSFGASIIHKKSELLPALKRAWKFGSSAIVEEYLKGTEISVGVLERNDGSLMVLPPIEIAPKKKFFDLKAKYDPKFCDEIVPARISFPILRKVQTFAKTAHRILRLRDLSRTDMIIVENKIYLLETNTIPGFTANSLYPKEARAAGIEFPDLCEQLIRLNLPRKT
jgi:D-alanine-D-alanine ligase